MKLASMSIDQRTCTVIVDLERMLCWPTGKSTAVGAISDLNEGLTRQVDPARGSSFTLEQLSAPLAAPPHNIMFVGKNYRAHAREFHRSGFDATADSDIPPA